MNNPFSRNRIKIDTETHCHILPALDCDPEFTYQALDVLRFFQYYGVHIVYVTPHIRLTRPSNTHKSLRERANVFKKQIEESKIKVDVRLVAEYYVDEGLSALIDTEPLLTYPEAYVLLELPLRTMPDNLDEIIYKLHAKNYKVIIAHPELHHYLRYDWKLIETLKSKGCLFQLNLINMAGYFGDDIVTGILHLLKSKSYDLLGTGAHSRQQMRLISEQLLQNKEYVNVLNNANFKNKMFAK